MSTDTTAPVPTFRRLDRSTGWVRDHVGEITSGGYPLTVHVTHDGDTSPIHIKYPTGYSSDCDWCYLGANHSDAAHADKVAHAHA